MSENPNNPQPQFNQDPQFSQQAPQYGQQAPYGQPVPTPEQQAQMKRAKILSDSRYCIWRYWSGPSKPAFQRTGPGFWFGVSACP